MKREEYLADDDVRSFIEWLRLWVCGKRFCHKYRMLMPPRDWGCTSLWQAFERYQWRGRCFCTNKQKLDKLARAIRTAESSSDFQKAARGILQWGGVASARTSAAFANPVQVRRYAERLDPATADTDHLHEIPMNSGWTKVYALMLGDLPMYDGRVGAALGYLVRKYCEENGRTVVPPRLRFRWHQGKGLHNRDPSTPTLHFPRLSHDGPRGPRAWAECNLRAAWILGAVCENGRFGRLHPRLRLRAVEAALFMIGYELPRGVGTRPR